MAVRTPACSSAPRNGDNGARVPYKASVPSLGLALLVSLVAATAVQLGFGAAFVSDGVAAATTCYATVLTLLFAGRDTESPGLADRWWVRVPMGIGSAALSLLLLRGPLRFALPLSEFQTTGHSPFVVFPVATLVGLGALGLLRRLPRRSQSS